MTTRVAAASVVVNVDDCRAQVARSVPITCTYTRDPVLGASAGMTASTSDTEVLQRLATNSVQSTPRAPSRRASSLICRSAVTRGCTRSIQSAGLGSVQRIEWYATNHVVPTSMADDPEEMTGAGFAELTVGAGTIEVECDGACDFGSADRSRAGEHPARSVATVRTTTGHRIQRSFDDGRTGLWGAKIEYCTGSTFYELCA
jgi:hypothetical protein